MITTNRNLFSNPLALPAATWHFYYICHFEKSQIEKQRKSGRWRQWRMVIFLGTGLPSKGLTANRPLRQSTVSDDVEHNQDWHHHDYINILKISNKIRIGDKVISSNEWLDLDKVDIFKVQPRKNIIIVICSYLDWISPFTLLQRNGKPENRNQFSVKMKILKISFIGKNFEKIKAQFFRAGCREWWIVRRGSTHENHQNNGMIQTMKT